MLIDSHHHLWKYSAQQYGWINDSMSVLKADYGPRELSEVAQDHGIDGFVAVQARQCLAENEALLSAADAEPRILGVVGWVPFAAADVKSELERSTADARMKGFRHVVQDEPDDRFLLRDDFNRGIGELVSFDLVYDLLIFAKQLPAAIEFVDRHPDQRFVLDHIAKPTIGAGEFDEAWERNFRELARRENVDCKFSGVVTEVRDQPWSIDAIRRYFDVALDAFTPSRLMFGSDWPVCLLQTRYTRWLETVRTLASELTDDQRDQFFGGTAARTYRLNS